MKHKNLKLSDLKKLAKKVLKEALQGKRIIGLVGPLGAGKTTFTKALAEGLGINTAKSPTFVVIHCYQHQDHSLYHIDLYRLEKNSELTALGLDEIMEDEKNIVVIEWIDKFPQLQKRCDIVIEFKTLKNNLRNVSIKYN